MSIYVDIVEHELIHGSVFYLEDVSSFEFFPLNMAGLSDIAGSTPSASVSIGTLQIEILLEHGTALCVRGLWPSTNWTLRELNPADVADGTLFLNNLPKLRPGDSIQIDQAHNWIAQHDKSSGWVRISENSPVDEEFIKIATNTLLGVEDGQLVSVMTKPTFVPTYEDAIKLAPAHQTLIRLPPKNREPTRPEIRQVLIWLIEGKLRPEEAENWAGNFIINDEWIHIDDPATWWLIKQLAGADMQTSPNEYFYDVEDFTSWLVDFEKERYK